MCNQASDYYVPTLKFVSGYYKSHKMCNKAVNTYLSTIEPVLAFIFSSLPDQYQTQGMCQRDVYADDFMLKYNPERYKAQKMC